MPLVADDIIYKSLLEEEICFMKSKLPVTDMKICASFIVQS